MKLGTFFRQVTPLLEGRIALAEGTRRLFPKPSVDARRLAIYARFCRSHRSEALGVFAYTRDVVVSRTSEESWLDLVERTFRAHPMHHFEMNENGAEFPTFLPHQLKRLHLPPFWAELADFEWWEWRTRSAPDLPNDAHDRGELRLGETVELRPYTRQWTAWIDEAHRRGDPEPGREVVLFWRTRDLTARREVASAAELAVLHAVYSGARPGSSELLREVLNDLREAGIVRGGQQE